MTATLTRTVVERPILFSGPMVRAILDGTKTQTRRVVLPQPAGGVRKSVFAPSGLEDGHGRALRPRHFPGERLWVRETFAITWCGADELHCYAADHSDEIVKVERWRPSIHMPRRLSRITLELTGVRVERVQDISEDDAIAEGLLAREGDGGAPGSGYKWKGTGYHGAGGSKWGPTFHVQNSVGSCACKVGGPTPAQCAYRELWDSLNAKRGYGWDVNPFVWVLEFRRAEV